jgi:hypothetical protein
MSGAPQGVYRRISVRVWTDKKFCTLSRLQPSGQALWLYLLSGPHTTALPGVFVAGRAALAEALGWSLEEFDRCLAELEELHMVEFDRDSRLWFIPKAIRHNTPANPNIVLAWRVIWAQLPEVPLRDRIAAALRESLSLCGPSFGKSFEEVAGLGRIGTFDMGSRKGSANGKGNGSVNGSGNRFRNGLGNQEQEQQQEQEKDPDEPPSLRSGGSVCENDSHLEPELPGLEPAPDGASSASPPAGVHPTPGPASHAAKAKAKATGVPPCPYEAIVALYHEVLPELPGVRLIDDKRQKAMRRVWAWCFTSTLETGQYRATNAQEALAWFRLFFDRVRTSDWLMGRTRRSAGHEGWECSLDYLMSPAGHKHVIERL